MLEDAKMPSLRDKQLAAVPALPVEEPKAPRRRGRPSGNVKVTVNKTNTDE